MTYGIRVKDWETDRRLGHNRVVATAHLSEPADATWRQVFRIRAGEIPGTAGGANVRYELNPGGDEVSITCPLSIVEAIKETFERFMVPQINRGANARLSLIA